MKAIQLELYRSQVYSPYLSVFKKHFLTVGSGRVDAGMTRNQLIMTCF